LRDAPHPASRTHFLHPNSTRPRCTPAGLSSLGEDSLEAPDPLHPLFFPTPPSQAPTAPSQPRSSRRAGALPDLRTFCISALHSPSPSANLPPFLLHSPRLFRGPEFVSLEDLPAQTKISLIFLDFTLLLLLLRRRIH
jgi:hypothetical protein